MELGRQERFYKVKWFWNILKYGMLFQGIRNRLAHIGIDVMPYYWTIEGKDKIKPPCIAGDQSGFEVSFLGKEDLVYVKQVVKGIAHKDLIKYFEDGQACIGLRCYKDLVAYMFVQRDNYSFRGRTFKFKSNEAYLHSMYTFESFRGRNIAPYLRYHCCELLKKEGIDTVYSITEYLNKSSIRFKKKLQVRHTELHLNINLFNKINKNILLRKYSF
ncbi:GNAT family N-acetyltransferase [Cognatitamlana onchidii]|uniref:GNAT family N-acetyltransferase n=1 Tax=Cognatitamlana onchidii TaxID=2562860 RepID=UPI0010A6861F|nr:GNAT family N-acetyltransferase [Algibacter onchidii]